MIYFDTLALGVHVAFGSVAVLMGAIAFAVRKGGKSHIKAGRAFAICMGLCSVFGGVIGLVKFETFLHHVSRWDPWSNLGHKRLVNGAGTAARIVVLCNGICKRSQCCCTRMCWRIRYVADWRCAVRF